MANYRHYVSYFGGMKVYVYQMNQFAEIVLIMMMLMSLNFRFNQVNSNEGNIISHVIFAAFDGLAV
jgi:hypothetical protein